MSNVKRDRWYLTRLLNINNWTRVRRARAEEEAQKIRLVKVFPQETVIAQLYALSNTNPLAREVAEEREQDYRSTEDGYWIGNRTGNKKQHVFEQQNTLIAYGVFRHAIGNAKTKEEIRDAADEYEYDLNVQYAILEQHTAKSSSWTKNRPELFTDRLQRNVRHLHEKYTRILSRSCYKIADRDRDTIVDVDILDKKEIYRDVPGVVSVWYYEELLGAQASSNLAETIDWYCAIVQKYHLQNEHELEYNTVYVIWHEPNGERREQIIEILQAEHPIFNSYYRFVPRV